MARKNKNVENKFNYEFEYEYSESYSIGEYEHEVCVTISMDYAEQEYYMTAILGEQYSRVLGRKKVTFDLRLEDESFELMEEFAFSFEDKVDDICYAQDNAYFGNAGGACIYNRMTACEGCGCCKPDTYHRDMYDDDYRMVV